jgi:hypothetical protein
MTNKKLTKEIAKRLPAVDKAILRQLKAQGPKSKLQLLKMLGPDIFNRLLIFAAFEEVENPLVSSITLYKVKDELCS